MRYFFTVVFALVLIGCVNQTEILSLNSLFVQQWSINKDTAFYEQNSIDGDAHINAWQIMSRYQGRKIKVAVIDNGFDVSHPEIKDQIIATLSIASNGSVTSDVSHSSSSDFHGTAVSGIIAAKNDAEGVRGVAAEVELILIKIPMESYTDATGISAFNEAMQYGADVISCSWGTGDVSDIVKAKIEEVAHTGRGGRGTIIVFAAGNDDAEIGNDESSIPSVLGVGASSKDNLRTPYSSFGATLDLVAPGGYALGITTIDPLEDAGTSLDGYIRYDEMRDSEDVFFIGTSAAAPIISGVIALLLEANPTLTQEEIFALLRSNSDKIGQNVPYIDEMISTNSHSPEITGILGTTSYAEIEVRLVSKKNNKIYGPYPISVNADNTWSSFVSNTLADGNYSIEVVSGEDNSQVYASDDNFEIGSYKEDFKDTTQRKNHYYGYGKVNVQNLFDAMP